MFNKIIFLAILALFSGFSLGVGTGHKVINSMGCHLNDGTCYIYIDEEVGPPSCHRNSIRWNKDKSSSGKETLAMLLAAFSAGKKVNLNIVGECYGAYPTFNYINIYQ